MSPPSAQYALKNPQHEAFRQRLLVRYRTSNCKCNLFVRAMHEEFPDLRMVPGYYYLPDGETSLGEHWWLQDPQGNIIDPTADQFECRDHGVYEPYDPAQHLTVKGCCLVCGVGLYLRQGCSACSQACAQAFSEAHELPPLRGPFDEDYYERLHCDMDIVTVAGLTLTLPDGAVIRPSAPSDHATQEATHGC
jgi:hypothetical protein